MICCHFSNDVVPFGSKFPVEWSLVKKCHPFIIRHGRNNIANFSIVIIIAIYSCFSLCSIRKVLPWKKLDSHFETGPKLSYILLHIFKVYCIAEPLRSSGLLAPNLKRTCILYTYTSCLIVLHANTDQFFFSTYFTIYYRIKSRLFASGDRRSRVGRGQMSFPMIQ